MDFDTGVPLSRESGTSLSPLLNQDAMWQMNFSSDETMEGGAYPERPGEPDCSYYIRTGLCRFGSTCRFNHPRDRKLAIAAARMKGEYPERIGQPECQYYLKTGTCKFGVTCKFHHPRNKAGIAGRVSLNVLGYPIRPNEVDCAYYLRTGHCKFGSTCKFNHPPPTNLMVPLRGSPVYPAVQSPTAGQQSYSWSRASFIANPRWQDPSSFASLILPQGMVSVQGWNTYSGQLGSVSSSGSPHQVTGNDHSYRNLLQNEAKDTGSPGSFSGFQSGSVPLGFYALPRENVFPERPGQPECQFYMKTGDCKFGAVCKFHHPRDRQIPAPDCVLSPIGLPLRPGEPLCVFYSRYGICKFGPSCKFDHPMRVFTYNNAASVNEETPLRHLLGSTSSGAASISLSSEELVETSASKPRRLSVSETRQAQSGKDSIDTEQ